MAATLPPGAMIRQIQALYEVGPMGHLSDGQLLERFASGGEAVSEAAFGLILDRHGPTVLRVCRGVLHDEHDAQDAFQATFLVLAQRAKSVRKRESVGPWLHGVALRVASAARRKAATRRVHERLGAIPEAVDGPLEPRDDLAPILHEELARLPDTQRAALVLCHLEGHTHEEAAERLSLPVGTVRSRLARGRDRLRHLLTRRGLAPTTAALAVAAKSSPAAAVVVPALLRASTLRAVTSIATGKTLAASGAGTTAVALASEALRALAWSGAARAIGAVCLLVITAGSAGVVVASANGFGPFAGLVSSESTNKIEQNSKKQADGPRNGPVGDVAGQVPNVAEPAATSQNEQQVIALRVVASETGEPIPGVSVQVSRREELALTTDAQGRCEVPADEFTPGVSPETLFIEVAKEGWVPRRISYSRDELQKDPSPSHTVILDPAVSIGGTVRDERDQPIAGVEVRVLFFGARVERGRESSMFDNHDTPLRTDAEGRWQLNMFPPDLSEQGGAVIVRLAHPDYVSDGYYSSRPRPAIPALRDQSLVLVMSDGVPIAGRVLGTNGEPVAGAEVDRRWSVSDGVQTRDDRELISTDADGRFRFNHVLPTAQVLLVRAEGYGLELREVPEDGPREDLTIQLGAGRTIEGRVVDDDGNPVAGATVVAGPWRGYQLGGWETTTGDDGRFRWEDAPKDAITISCRPPVLWQGVEVEAQPGATDITITVDLPLRFRGQVTDAQTGKPVERFQVVPGFMRMQEPIFDDAGREQPRWLYRGAKPFEDGRFEFDFANYEQSLPRQLRIEAEGYLPMASRAFSQDDGPQVWNVALLPGPGVEGIVRAPGGEPVAGVEMFLAGPGTELRFEDGQVKPGQTSAAEARTGPDGRFWFARPDGPYLLFAHSEQGVAEIRSDDLEATLDVQLQPWGRVEGTVRVGAEPRAREHVSVSSLYLPRSGPEPSLSHSTTTTTDDRGHFAVERIVPGVVTVARELRTTLGLNGPTTMSSHRQVIDFEPGQTARVDLGGTGQPVLGRLVLPGGTVPLINPTGTGAMLRVKQPEPYPEGFLGWEQDRKRAWWPEFYKTPAGRAYARRDHRYIGTVSADGSLRIDDVPPGAYTLHVFTSRPRVGPGGQAAGTISGGTRLDVVVPEIPGEKERTDTPHDLGAVELTLTAFQALGVGDVAPDFEIETLDREPFRLADTQGKFVLLDFWATWCGPCLEQTPHLKDVQEAFGADERFALIGISLDDEPDAPRRYVETQGLDWLQGHLGESAKSTVLGDYGVQGIPHILLIGPDGRILAKDLRGDGIMQAVAEALGAE